MLPGFEALLMIFLIVVLAIGSGALYAALARRPASRAVSALAEGDFEAVLEEAATDSRPDAIATAIAAKHLLNFDRAEELLARLVDEDAGDGEAWLERGLVAAYATRWKDAEKAFATVVSLRSDLLEPVTLHRAWAALAQGDNRRARKLFEDVEAPIESKLRIDIGGGDPLFAEWFWQASRLWASTGAAEAAEWAWKEGCDAAPTSQLPTRI